MSRTPKSRRRWRSPIPSLRLPYTAAPPAMFFDSCLWLSHRFPLAATIHPRFTPMIASCIRAFPLQLHLRPTAASRNSRQLRRTRSLVRGGLSASLCPAPRFFPEDILPDLSSQPLSVQLPSSMRPNLGARDAAGKMSCFFCHGWKTPVCDMVFFLPVVARVDGRDATPGVRAMKELRWRRDRLARCIRGACS